MSIESMEAPRKLAKSNEWYTPAKYIEAAREVMDGIDLDPASCALANETVRAAQYYDEAMNGLEQRWHGRVWLNPPYGKVDNKSIIAMFAKKLLAEYRADNVTEAVMLSIVRTESAWFHLLWEHCICFADHYVHFYKPINGILRKDSRHGHFFGTAFVYLGSNEQKFINVFSAYGTIARRVNQEPA